MKIRFLLGCLLTSASFAAAQVTPKAFWKEDFSSGKLPQGWVLTDNSKTEKCSWIVTDQPYPGSFQFNQQQPPIASTSRGFHLQYRPGVVTGDEVTKWNQRKQYPDASVQTAAIDCSQHRKVILNFEQNFRWNSWFTAKGAGLYVGVSNDGKNWKEYDMKGLLPSDKGGHKALKEEINISDVAGGQKTVYLRFSWRGIFSWFWMIDDISLSDPLNRDVAIKELTSHKTDNNLFTANDTVRVRLKNMGAQPIREDLPVILTLDGKKEFKAVLQASEKPLEFNEEREVTFPSIDLKGMGAHTLQFKVDMAGDERESNNSLERKLYASKTQLGEITGIKRLSEAEYEITSHFSKAKLIFYRDDIFRLWLAPNGEYTNPAGDEIVVDYTLHHPSVSWSNKGDYYMFRTRKCVVRLYKKPMRLAMYDRANRKMIFEESEPLTFGTKTYQSLKRDADENFYGGGMQHGSIGHAGKAIDISVTGWDDGQVSNPAPFYMSTKGYGVFRNTFAPGKYAFDGQKKEQMEFDGTKVEVSRSFSTLTHDENRFDAFYFFGPSLKEVLNGYTEITGRPFMPAMWMLTLGDSDCYNSPEQRVRWAQTTPDVIGQIADEYIRHDMPRGWILPNDGYGCGYQKLDSVVSELGKRGFKTGLWTENGVDKIAYEVGSCGSRVCKLDVAWIGEGYDFALNGCKSAYEGIQNNSNERGFVWSVCGWAGTQRYSTVWSGDQSSNWDYIRYHIPTIAGAGMSAFNAATSDIDGIFGGSARTYTRDLQWKCFTPIMMVMSGWAEVDRQPWLYGHPYEEINRKFLRLKMRLLPYLYTCCHQAHTSGVPTVRPMVLEFPEDGVTRTDSADYQFMSGEWLLVAPVYDRTNWRENIYLPEGKWYDYWDGTEFEGKQWIRKYEARLDKLPLFVREGAIIPYYPYMDYVGQKRAETLTLQIFPCGKETSFNLYEDDLITRDFEKGEYATTLISQKREKNGVTIRIRAAEGAYKGMYKTRNYILEVAGEAPSEVKVNGQKYSLLSDRKAFDDAESGCFYDKELRKGTLLIKINSASTAEDCVVNVQ